MRILLYLPVLAAGVLLGVEGLGAAAAAARLLLAGDGGGEAAAGVGALRSFLAGDGGGVSCLGALRSFLAGDGGVSCVASCCLSSYSTWHSRQCERQRVCCCADECLTVGRIILKKKEERCVCACVDT